MRIWRDLPTEGELRDGGVKEKRVLDAVTEYHSVRKDLLGNLFPRIGKLLQVIDAGKKSAGMAGRWTSASSRWFIGPARRSSTSDCSIVTTP
jgi:hypothetical protein